MLLHAAPYIVSLLVIIVVCSSISCTHEATASDWAVHHRLLLQLTARTDTAASVPTAGSPLPTTTTTASSSSSAQLVWVWDWHSGLALLLATINSLNPKSLQVVTKVY
jgi:hypothetical protein